jgi:Mrp family chromosome partitioning ATPase
VKVLLDSLNEIERERDAFGLPGGGDSAAAALAARATTVGQAIQAIGRTTRDSLRQLTAGLSVAGEEQLSAGAPATDTIGWVAERDSARSMVVEAETALVNARRRADDFDRDVARDRAAAQVSAPPVALLGAALVIGVVLGFGAAFFGEMRNPRISDEHEVERATGVRVLATARRRPRDPNRDRRLADRVAPPYFDPRAPSYQLTYLHVVRAGATRLSLTITGADTGIAAVVAMNVAAIAADEARSTILIDTDALVLPVAAALRCHAEPGIADILRSHIDWAEVTTQTMAGRNRTIDVIPSGISPTPLDPAAVTDLFRQEALRLARHYEAIVVVASLEHVVAGLGGALPVPDVVVCARVGHTRLADLRAALDGIRQGGGTPIGVVLWDSVPPPMLSAERVESSPRPLQTAEMQTLTRKQ